MQLELRSIFVDRNSDRVNQLVTNYRSDIRFQVTDFVNSAHKAVQSIVEEPYHVWFIDESVPAEEANVLFSDVGKIEGREKCVFIQVREEIPEEFNFEQLQQLGYDQAITRKGTHQERTGLAQLLAERFRETEVEVRKFNVGSTLKMVMDAIDTAASNRRRGYKSSVHTLPVEFVELQTSFADEILEDYFEMLLSLIHI